MKQLFSVILFFSAFTSAFAQFGTLKGVVRTSGGDAVNGATLKVIGTALTVMSDERGAYVLDRVPYGKHMLEVSSVEVHRERIAINIDQEVQERHITVKAKGTIGIEDVRIEGKTVKRDIETSGFAVAVIETKEASLRNLTTNELLDRAVGVRVRQNGGIGSQIEYNLNGMSGSAIGIFLDGTPISTFGSSFNLNNIPPAMIERIEVYKGVLPSHLTGDYVGGAINVVMKKDASANNVTAAVSYGSFNTFQADVGALYRDQKSGFTTRISGFYTYTDNDYEMWGKFAMKTESDLTLTRYNRFKRFNNTYKSVGGRFEFGFTDVKWADQFFLGYNISDTYRDIPHGTTMAQPYVGRFNEYQAHVFSLNYNKANLF